MSTPDTQTETPGAPVHVPFDETLRQAWARYGNLVYIAVAVVIVGIIGKGTWEYLAAQKEASIERDFAACSSPDSYKAFAAAHEGHPLAGMAELKTADDSYSAGRFDEARSAYLRAAADVQEGPFKSHALMGAAVSAAAAGKTADAETALKQLFNDTNQLKSVRCEAGFHLATLAAQAGRASEVQSIAEQLLSINPSSPYAERAFTLRSEMAAK